MKKIYFSLIFGCLLVFSTCKKDSSEYSNPYQKPAEATLNAVKIWHQSKINDYGLITDYNGGFSGVKLINVEDSKLKRNPKLFLSPKWENARTEKLFNGNSIVMVPAEDFQIVNEDVGFYREFVFVEGKGKVSSGQIVEIYGSPSYIKENKDRLISNFNHKIIEGFTGAIITYDIYYRPLRNRSYKNGKVFTANTAITKKAINSSLSKSAVVADCGGETTTRLAAPACYGVYWVTKDFSGNENWEFLYSYCEAGAGCGGGGAGGGGGTEPIIPISNFSNFPPNPIDGSVYVLVYPSGDRVEFTYNQDLGKWLMPEVQALRDVGYSISLAPNGPPQFGGAILSTVALFALADPEPFGKILLTAAAGGIAAVYLGYYLYDLYDYYQTTKDDQEDTRNYCIGYFVGCQHQTPNAPCDDCLNFCVVQGYWSNQCSGIIPQHVTN